jgi:hypothetical protein
MARRRSRSGDRMIWHNMVAASIRPQVQSFIRQDRLRNPPNRLSDIPPTLSSSVIDCFAKRFSVCNEICTRSTG